MASYGMHLRSYSHIIQWVDYHKYHHEVRLKGPNYLILAFTIDLIGRQLWWKFSS